LFSMNDQAGQQIAPGRLKASSVEASLPAQTC